MAEEKKDFTYTCSEYREEMILASLQRRMQQEGLEEGEKLLLQQEIKRLEEQMGL